MIQALYSEPIARVKVNVDQPDYFSQQRGSRQGGSNSPLFTLFLELVLSRYHNFELGTGTRKKILVLDTNSIPR